MPVRATLKISSGSGGAIVFTIPFASSFPKFWCRFKSSHPHTILQGAGPTFSPRPSSLSSETVPSCWFNCPGQKHDPVQKTKKDIKTTLLSLQQALSADDCLITSRQTIKHSDASYVLRRSLLKQVVEDLRCEVVRCVVVAADSFTQFLHRAQL